MKEYRYLIASIICLGTVSMVGCSKNVNSIEEKSEMTMDDEINIEENSITDQGDIQETITENLTVNTKIEIPGKSFATYNTEYKNFDNEKIVELLWPESSEEEIQINEYDGGASEITFQDETVALGAGVMKYDKNDEIKYLSSLASYAEENALLEKKNLSFMKEEEAISNIEAFLSSLELGTSLGERETFALSKEDMLSIQNAMKSDEDYKSFYESGKFQEQIFDADDEMYYIKYSFSLDGVPVFGEGDPTVQMSGGVEQPLLADPMGATFLFSNSGICEIRLTGMVNQLNIETENQEIIRFDGIKKALVKKFGDVILSDNYNLSNMWLEYFPKRKEDSFDKVELIPVWCCKFDINGDINVDYALRFNAITGEEIS
ncbi:hypothetical protein [Blautia obeum]|uniref:hypothetical protein n=1 Tax=Blautia obeum TaxID=40520 RepID=UPI0034A49885